MRLRTHRALSGLERAESESSDDDARFLFLWIAFNAPTPARFRSATGFSERRVRMNFLRELIAADEEGLLLLTRAQRGNQVRYQANRSAPIYEELAGIFRKTSGLVDVLRESLQGLADRIDVAFVFGSMASGKPRAGSDVDILVIGTVSLLDVVKALGQAQERLGREMNPVVMPRERFLEAKESGDRFVQRLMREPKLFVSGDAARLGKA